MSTCSTTKTTTTPIQSRADGAADRSRVQEARRRSLRGLRGALQAPLQMAAPDSVRRRSAQGSAERRRGAARASSSNAATGIREQDAKLRRPARTADQRRIPTKRCWSSPSLPTRFAIWKHNCKARGITKLAGVTGDSDRPDRAAPGVSARSATTSAIGSRPTNELRVLVATDVLSEGQNLQDAAIVVNYDLPWAIIRLIQRAGRVDRIGQQADEDSLLLVPAGRWRRAHHPPARARPPAPAGKRRSRRHGRGLLRGRPERSGRRRSLPRESRHPRRRRRHRGRPGLLCLPDLEERHRPRSRRLQKMIPDLPPVVFSTRSHHADRTKPPDGVLVYLRTPKDNDALAWVDKDGEQRHRVAVRRSSRPPSASPTRRRCRARTIITSLVAKASNSLSTRKRPSAASSAGRRAPASAPTSGSSAMPRRSRARCSTRQNCTRPSRTSTATRCASQRRDTLNRQLRSGISDRELAELVIALRDEDRLCVIARRRADSGTADHLLAGARAGHSRADVAMLDIDAHPRTTAERSTSADSSSRNSAGTDTTSQLDVAGRRPDLRPARRCRRSAAWSRLCSVRMPTAALPDHATRRKIERQVAKSAHEHLIVFTRHGQDHADLAVGQARAGQAAACREHTIHRRPARRRADPEARSALPSA